MAILLFDPTSALAQPPTADEILVGNREAMGSGWRETESIKLEYDYRGQELTGTNSSLQDLVTGAFVDSYDE